MTDALASAAAASLHLKSEYGTGYSIDVSCPDAASEEIAGFEARKAQADAAFRRGSVGEAIELYSALLEEREDDLALLSCAVPLYTLRPACPLALRRPPLRSRWRPEG